MSGHMFQDLRTHSIVPKRPYCEVLLQSIPSHLDIFDYRNQTIEVSPNYRDIRDQGSPARRYKRLLTLVNLE